MDSILKSAYGFRQDVTNDLTKHVTDKEALYFIEWASRSGFI